MNWYWGDIHCHTNLSYGRGTIERAYEIVHTHLDFCSVTGHAFWPDMPEDLQDHEFAGRMEQVKQQVLAKRNSGRRWPLVSSLSAGEQNRSSLERLMAGPMSLWGLLACTSGQK